LDKSTNKTSREYIEFVAKKTTLKELEEKSVLKSIRLKNEKGESIDKKKGSFS